MMKRQLNRISMLTCAVILTAGSAAFGQHESHQAPASQEGAKQVGEQALAGCPESARSALQTLDVVKAQLEHARQNNNPADMRHAVDMLQATVDHLRAQVEACTAEQGVGKAAPSMEHMGHAQPVTLQAQQPADRPTSTAGQVDHSKMGHSMMGHETPAAAATTATTTVVDPVCAKTVDPKSAPQATYEGRTYYFCSESDRQKFLADPARIVK